MLPSPYIYYTHSAVADYATSEAAFETSEEAARAAATTFFKSLEAYDRCLANALRSGELDLPDARSKLQVVISDLDKYVVCVCAVCTCDTKPCDTPTTQGIGAGAQGNYCPGAGGGGCQQARVE